MIQRAMKDSHVNLKLNQPAKKQALETIAILKKHMRIERKQMLIRLLGKKRSRNRHDCLCTAENAISSFCDAEGIQIKSKCEGIQIKSKWEGIQIKSKWEGDELSYELIIDTKSYKAIESFCQEHPSCSCEILQRQYIPEEKPQPSAPVEIAKEDAPSTVAATTTAPTSQTSRFKCSTCQAGFQDTNAYREHFRSDWHRFNLKRKNKGLSCLSEEDYIVLDDAERELFLSQDSIAT